MSEASPGITFLKTIPILRIFDDAKTREFYVDYLGFTVEWEHRFGDNFPLYMQISRGALIFHLSEHHGDSSPGARTFIEMQGIHAFHAELAAKEYRYMKPCISKEFYGWCMNVSDPFGNRLTFVERFEG